MVHGRRIHEGSGCFRKKLVDGLQRLYSRMAADRAAHEQREQSARRGKMSNEEWLRDIEKEMMERKAQGYMQPVEATWREFLEHRHWTPTQVDELPDDWLYGEWMRFLLARVYGVNQPGGL